MYLYSFNYREDEREICLLEQKYLFDISTDKKYFFTDKYIDVNRSPFVKFMIDVRIMGNSLGELVDFIFENNVKYDNFKVYYVNADGKMEFNKKHRIEGIIGMAIDGEAKIHNPDVVLGVTLVDGKWIFGEFNKNKNIWDLNMEKPYQYCNALTSKLSRAIVNIAASNKHNLKMVDPCCGIGTVVVEALSMGFNIEGYDINSNIVYRARKNLDYLGYDSVINVSDIKDIKDTYDIAFVDLPYGILSKTTREMQIDIIKNARRIAKRMLLISVYDMSDDIKECGFKIIDICEFRKGKFLRYITLCE